MIAPSVLRVPSINNITPSARSLNTSEPEPLQRIKAPAKNIVDAGIKVVDFVTSLPSRGHKAIDDISDFAIKEAQRFKSGAAEKTTENFTNNKLQTIGRNAAIWIQSPKNALMALAGIIGLFVLIRKL